MSRRETSIKNFSYLIQQISVTKHEDTHLRLAASSSLGFSTPRIILSAPYLHREIFTGKIRKLPAPASSSFLAYIPEV
jgi:hypothetical protein